MARGKKNTGLARLARESGVSRQAMHLRAKRGLTGDDLSAKGSLSERLLTHEGRSQSIAAWARELGLPARTLYNRIYAGMPVRDVLSPGRLPHGPPKSARIEIVLLPGYAERLRSLARAQGMTVGRWVEAQIDRQLSEVSP